MVGKIIRHFFSKSLLKHLKLTKPMSGFTLLELLIALVMASIIVSTLLTFLASVLDSDRKEQAKSESQEEIQAALNYIADDLQQAVYIYDADGLYINGASDGLNVAGQIPSNPNWTPVLVFWKRAQLKSTDQIVTSSGATKFVGCLDYPDNNATTCLSGTQPKGSDKYVYSIVAYYLVKDNDASWSNTARISRWELRDGVRWNCFDGRLPTDIPPSVCGTADYQLRTSNTATPADVVAGDTNRYSVYPNPNFLRFDISGSGNLSARMNRWRRGGTVNQTLTTLVDYIDDTTYTTAQDNPGVSPIKIGLSPNTAASGATFPVTTPSKNPDCDTADKGVGVGLPDAQLGTAIQTTLGDYSQRIPPDFGNATYNPIASQPSSFYACVNANKVVARVYIRGNALARLQTNINFRTITDDKSASFIPTANVRAFGRGSLSTDDE